MGCCAARDKSGFESPNALPLDMQIRFNSDLTKAIDREKLQREVLSEQNVLDFDSYKEIMGLVSAYAGDLTLRSAQRTFEARLSLLKKIQEGGLEEDENEYSKLVLDQCSYQQRIQTELLQEVQTTLDIKDDVLSNSHDTYDQRKELYDYMDHMVAERQNILLKNSKHIRAVSKEEEVKIYDWYSEQLKQMNEAVHSDKEQRTVEELSLRIEDRACLEFNLTSTYQLKQIATKMTAEYQQQVAAVDEETADSSTVAKT